MPWVWPGSALSARRRQVVAYAPQVMQRYENTVSADCHLIRIDGVYDRHKYEEQMRVAFEKLSNMIDQIVYSAKGKVIQFPA
jgi:hypothetical protein